MSNLHLVTGYAGEAHITAEDHGSFNAALTEGGNYVLRRGNRLSASIINNTTVRVLDGDLLIQGRHVRLSDSSYVDLNIETGTQGKYRKDLIVARYTRNTVTGVEECNLVVIKGTSVASNPVDPAYTSGDLLVNHDAQADFPLYRVLIDGVKLQAVEQLFEVITFVTVGADGKINNSFLPAMDFVPLSQKGKASGVATLDGSGKIPTDQVPVLDYIPTNKRGEASGVASLDANGKVPAAQIPDMNCIKNDKIGVAGGVVPLGENLKIDKAYIPPGDYDMTSGTLPFSYSRNHSDGKTTVSGTVKYTKIGSIVVANVEATVKDTNTSPIGYFTCVVNGIPSGKATFVVNGGGPTWDIDKGFLENTTLEMGYDTQSSSLASGLKIWASFCYLTT